RAQAAGVSVACRVVLAGAAQVGCRLVVGSGGGGGGLDRKAVGRVEIEPVDEIGTRGRLGLGAAPFVVRTGPGGVPGDARGEVGIQDELLRSTAPVVGFG